ncbi:MAG: O-antigen ligase family protein [Selenomonas sp.]
MNEWTQWNPVIRDRLFFLMTVSTLFIVIPKAIRVPFIGGPFGGMLLFWPLAAGVVYSIACEQRTHDVFADGKIFWRWMFLYWGVLLLSSIHGMMIFPYMDDVVQGSTGQIDSVTMVLAYADYFGISVSKEFLIRAWMLLSPIKNLVLNSLYPFGAAYLVYCWYRRDPEQGIRVMCKGVLAGFVLIALLACIELPCLAGNETAKWLLKLVTPFLHSIKEANGWWPPLLWAFRTRAMFAEPSHLGIYFGWAMPLFFLFYLHVKTLRVRVACGVVLFLCGVELFLTLSRTAMGLFLVALVIFFAGVWLARRIIAVRQALTIVLIVAAAYVGAIQFWQLAMGTTMLDTSQAYLEETVGKAAAGTTGSSRTRYGVIGAELRMGRDHFLLGVGPQLQRAYILDYLDESDIEASEEMQMWVRQQKAAGRMIQQVPDLCEYPHLFAETGAVGLLVYLLPTFFLLYAIFRRLWLERCTCVTTLLLLASFLTTIVSATLSAPLIHNPAHFLLLGFIFAYVRKKEIYEQ